VAAAFVSAGLDLRLNSYDAVPGELAVAEQLVKALPHKVAHVVTGRAKPAAVPAPMPEVVERIKRWHRYAEGLRPASYLFHAPPDGLVATSHLAIGGAGGEVAHGHFYPRDVLAIDLCPLEMKVGTFTQQLQARLVPATGPSQATRDAVAGQIQRVFREAVQGGFENAKMLDYFYVVERLRRWGTAGERTGVVSPLLVPAFIRGAFSLSAPQRLGNELHRALVRELVPQWAAISFFTPHRAPAAKTKTTHVKRLGEAPDRDLIGQLLQADRSGDFDPAQIHRLWKASLAGQTTAADEIALHQLLWRAAFDDHLAEVNQHIAAPEPRPAPIVVRRTEPTLRARLRRYPAVRRLARTQAWHIIRERLRD
jgi:hypothetical protein